MKRELVILCSALFLTAVPPLFAQQNCFGNCWENYDSIARNVPLSERFKAQYWLFHGMEGCELPSFSATSLDGSTISSESLLGKVVVINFWFESCPPCRTELPSLNKLADQFEGEDVVFLAFGRDSEQSIRAFLDKQAFRFIHVADCFNNGMIDRFCIMSGFPTNMVFDKTGRLVHISSGGSVDPAKQNEKYETLLPVIQAALGRGR